VQEIINSHQHGKGNQYLVHWTGYGHKHNWWLVGSSLEDCTMLDTWLMKDLGAGIGTW
jgi:hypothetical protein